MCGGRTSPAGAQKRDEYKTRNLLRFFFFFKKKNPKLKNLYKNAPWHKLKGANAGVGARYGRAEAARV